MRTDYALRALGTLVEHYRQGPVSIREIASRNDIPKRFLEHILLDLKGRGWVVSSPGKLGGYLLAKSPEQITMGEVVRFFEGAIAPLDCVSASRRRHCSREMVCRFRLLLLNIRNHAARLMDQSTLATVFRGATAAHPEVLLQEFTGGAGI